MKGTNRGFWRRLNSITWYLCNKIARIFVIWNDMLLITKFNDINWLFRRPKSEFWEIPGLGKLRILFWWWGLRMRDCLDVPDGWFVNVLRVFRTIQSGRRMETHLFRIRSSIALHKEEHAEVQLRYVIKHR